MPSRNIAVPADVPGQLELVGTTAFGADYKAKLAAGLNIGRTTLFELQRGQALKRGRRICGPELRARIIDLLDREEDHIAGRREEVSRLRKKFIELNRQEGQ